MNLIFNALILFNMPLELWLCIEKLGGVHATTVPSKFLADGM